jgi:hypothetical protein
LLEGQTPSNEKSLRLRGENKANISQKGSVGFETTMNLNKRKRQSHVSVYVKNVDLISLRISISIVSYLPHAGAVEAQNPRNAIAPTVVSDVFPSVASLRTTRC